MIERGDLEMTHSFIKAEANDHEALTDLMVDSEGYWGNSQAFLTAFRRLYAVTPSFIENHMTLVLTKEGHRIGFYGLALREQGVELQYFFIAPEYIGRGYGKIMWHHLINQCEKKGIHTFEWVTSPEAKGFYQSLGAIQKGTRQSLISEGRTIPVMVYTLHDPV